MKKKLLFTIPVLLILFSFLFGQTGRPLRTWDTNLTDWLYIVWNENDTADRTFNITVNGADRTFALHGNLTVESASLINQDLTTDSSTGQLAALTLGTGELTAGSINRASGTLLLEIGGTPEISITSSSSTFGGNIALAANSITGTSVDINNAEMQQLSLIAAVTISNAQWAYLGASNQGITQTSAMNFGGLTVTKASNPTAKFIRTSAATNVPQGGLIIKHLTSGVMAAGFGAQLSFLVEDDSAVEQTLARIEGIVGSSDSEGDLVFKAGSSGNEEFLRIDETGFITSTQNSDTLTITGTGSDFTYDTSDGVHEFLDTAMINETINTFMTMGLTINQGAATNEIIGLKQSGVAHGITDLVETDTFGTFALNHDSGLDIRGYSNAETGVKIIGYATNDMTDKDSSADGYILFATAKKDGTGVANPGADANIFVVNGGLSNTIMILDQEGMLHLDSTVAEDAWDDYDDIALSGDLSRVLSNKWDETIKYSAQDMHDAGLITLTPESKNKRGRDEIFINVNNMLKLSHFAMRQAGQEIDFNFDTNLEQQAQIETLETRITYLENLILRGMNEK